MKKNDIDCLPFNQRRRKCRRTLGSDWKMASGIARSVTGEPSGFFDMMYLHAKPASFTIWSPKNSARRFAVEIDVDFCAP